MDVPILTRTPRRLVCPNCAVTELDNDQRPNAQVFHNCAGLRGLSAPLVDEGTDCKVFARDRQDYVGDELVTRDGDGRPVMSVVTEYGDGRNDAAVFAPCATGGTDG